LFFPVSFEPRRGINVPPSRWYMQPYVAGLRIRIGRIIRAKLGPGKG